MIYGCNVSQFIQLLFNTHKDKSGEGGGTRSNVFFHTYGSFHPSIILDVCSKDNVILCGNQKIAFFYFTLAFDCLFEISLNTNTFKQQQKKPSLLSFLHSSHLPLCVPSQSTDISVSRPSEVMRTVIDQLFQQEMRGHLSEACLNSDLYGYRVVPGQPFTCRPNCVAYSSRRESYFPTRS